VTRCIESYGNIKRLFSDSIAFLNLNKIIVFKKNYSERDVLF